MQKIVHLIALSASDNSSDDSFPEPTPVLAPVQPLAQPTPKISQSFPKISQPRDLHSQPPQPRQYVKHRSLNFQHEQVSIGGRHDPPTYDIMQSLRHDFIISLFSYDLYRYFRFFLNMSQ